MKRLFTLLLITGFVVGMQNTNLSAMTSQEQDQTLQEACLEVAEEIDRSWAEKKLFQELQTLYVSYDDTVAKCPICLEHDIKKSMHKTLCGHFFHQQCLEDSLKNKALPICPVCRQWTKPLTINIDVCHTDEDGATLLHYTAMHGCEVLALLCLSKGADVNAEGPRKMTPLHLAAGNNHPFIVKILLRAPEINVNATNILSLTPLHTAVVEDAKHVGIVKMLTSATGIDVNSRCISRNSPLYYAVMAKNLPAVRVLLNTPGIKINEKNGFGVTPLALAERYNYAEIAQLLRAHGATT